ncbi:hypothetical protein HK097_010992 [Rhizophlyctis rosea]|uniref:Uncharacterized protein n=1 Tax=Rhizophlyctis rosea TaxID=64517 RepID=A0AAD5S8K2_9FUNG|nr:hypothetical protein HK097_010992 [Rhizophlyctis rosea]
MASDQEDNRFEGVPNEILKRIFVDFPGDGIIEDLDTELFLTLLLTNKRIKKAASPKRKTLAQLTISHSPTPINTSNASLINNCLPTFLKNPKVVAVNVNHDKDEEVIDRVDSWKYAVLLPEGLYDDDDDGDECGRPVLMLGLSVNKTS